MTPLTSTPFTRMFQAVASLVQLTMASVPPVYSTARPVGFGHAGGSPMARRMRFFKFNKPVAVYVVLNGS